MGDYTTPRPHPSPEHIGLLKNNIKEQLKRRPFQKWTELRVVLLDEEVFGPKIINEYGPDIFFELLNKGGGGNTSQLTTPPGDDKASSPSDRSDIDQAESDEDDAEDSGPTFLDADVRLDIMTVLQRPLGDSRRPMSARSCQERRSYINESVVNVRGFAADVHTNNTVVLEWRRMEDDNAIVRDGRFHKTCFKVAPEDRMGGVDVALGTGCTDEHYATSEPGAVASHGQWSGSSSTSPEDLDESAALLSDVAKMNLASAKENLRQKRRAFSETTSHSDSAQSRKRLRAGT